MKYIISYTAAVSKGTRLQCKLTDQCQLQMALDPDYKLGVARSYTTYYYSSSCLYHFPGKYKSAETF